MSRYDEVIKSLGFSLPEPPAPMANFVPYTISGSHVYISGQISGRTGSTGKLGRDITIEQGQEAARGCALNVLAWLKRACAGDLDRVVRCVQLRGYVNCVPEFTDQPQVINGASDLIVSIFGEQGRHARTAIGVNSLPLGAAVEVDAVFEISQE
jgi:enamine deaminase RidA (YjgF/YER057c/UK114 family)